MSTEASHRQRLPAPCQHCRGVLYQHFDTCPYCGMSHPLDFAAPPPAPVAHATVRAVLLPDKPVPAVTPNLPSAVPPSAAVARRAPWRAIASAPRAFATRAAAPSGAAARGLLALAVVVVIAGAYGLYALTGRHAGSQSSDHTQDTQTTTGMIAARESAAAHSSDDVRAPATPPAFRDVAEGLAAARAHRDAHDLGGAQAALDATLSIAPQDTAARALQRELAPLEAQRDVALQAARTCRANRQWPCVAQRASDALAIDRGSADAQALLERAIVETGWTQPGARATSAAAPQAAQAAGASAAIDPQIRAITASGWLHAPGAAASAPGGSAAPAR